jgi:DNA-binding transcriptional LysR family regulator
MDRFDAIQAFVAVAEQSGFAPAARKLGLSTSAATRHVAALEEHLGVRLLNRTTRAVSLTDAGQRFLAQGKSILADLEQAELMAETERAEPSGKISIAAPQVFGRLHIAPLVCEFLVLNPKVRAELVLGDRIVNLVEDGIDVALRIGHLGDSGDIARKVGAVRRVLVASPAYLAKFGMPSRPQDLASHQLISFTALTHETLWRFWKGQVPQDVSISPIYSTNSADAALWHAAHDGGISFALSYQVADAVREGRLHVVLSDYEPPHYPVQFVYSSSRLLSVKVRSFIDHAAKTRDWEFLEFDRV